MKFDIFNHQGVMQAKIDVLARKAELPFSAYPHNELKTFNAYINSQIKYVPDVGSDVWSAPDKTWRKKRGDCEDIAILKYHLLKGAQYVIQSRLLVCKRLKYGDNHCVLAVDQLYQVQTTGTCILDNVNDKILSFSDFLKDHYIHYAIDEHNVYIPRRE